ncbi:MAG: lytic murein transglycosylase B [Gammaproteobacteria bacterium]|nr:lytic murein transglycosylase B [Gammaproteobacteria bacterium]
MRFHPLLSLLLLCLLSTTAHALHIDDYPALQSLASEMADKHEFSSEQIRRTFRCVKIRPDIIEAMQRPKELLPWYDYKNIFLTEQNAERGAQFWKKHADILQRVHTQTGVAPEIIVAILGVETQYGRHAGNYPVLDALTTLTLDYPERADFFRRELVEFLLLAREIKVNPCQVKGSYAGALGLPQFMPSSYRRFAVDSNGDGKRDILTSADDTIASVAHYLRENGWEADGPIVDDVQIEGTLYFWIEKLGFRPTLPASKLASYGIFPRRRDDLDRRAALISFEGETGPFYRLGYNNFYVITRYNRNKRYALAVYELGNMIRKRIEEKS